MGYQIDKALFAEFVDTKSEPELIADGCVWTEGPVWLDDRLYFNDIPNKRMLSWHASNGVEVVLDNSEYANGNTLDMEGQMVSCEHGGRRVVRRESSASLNTVSVIADKYNAKRLNSPNDVVVKSDGSVWFTDPSYGIDSNKEGYKATSEIGSNNVYRVDPDGAVVAVVDDFDKPNGLAFSPDEQLLYVTDSGAARGEDYPGLDLFRPHHIRVFQIQNNQLNQSRVFANIDSGVPDGLRVDTQGYVWCCAGDGIHCFSPHSELLGKILLPAAAANCCFGGETGTDLFVTATDAVFRIRTTRLCAQSLRHSHARKLNAS